MPHITYIESDGTTHRVEADAGRSLMQIAVEHAIPGILGDCGGACSCATCHAYVDTAWISRLPPRSESEAFMLEGVADLRENSRLCCQIRVQPDLDGMIVRLPAEQG
ncbi:MAG: 2Fe-2S iron-sulfur cluster binding domain-containing protein [Burkholderiaceae bacterium]|nr:2Fe-2S iron-sulfur cluster binding domain-containing protein [Burkholderiaceae bacterium]